MLEVMVLSRTGRVTIPKSVYELVGWKPGDKLVPMIKDGTVTLVPVEKVVGVGKHATGGETHEHGDCV